MPDGFPSAPKIDWVVEYLHQCPSSEGAGQFSLVEPVVSIFILHSSLFSDLSRSDMTTPARRRTVFVSRKESFSASHRLHRCYLDFSVAEEEN